MVVGQNPSTLELLIHKPEFVAHNWQSQTLTKRCMLHEASAGA